MIEEVVLNYIILFIVLELYEVQWQKASTIVGMLARMFESYKKSIFLFLVMHPTYYFAMWLMLVTEYNEYALLLFAIKTLDIGMKLALMNQVFIKKEVTHEVSMALLAPLKSYIPYIGLVAYSPLIFLALT